MSTIIAKLKHLARLIPFREILIGVLSSLLSAYLIVSYNQYKQAETMFLQIRKEVKTSVATIKTITADKNLGTPLMPDVQIPNKYWSALTSDDQNLLNRCDPNKNVEKFYTQLDVLRTYYDLVARFVTAGRMVPSGMNNTIDKTQLVVATAAIPAETSAAYCHDSLFFNRLKVILYKTVGKI